MAAARVHWLNRILVALLVVSAVAYLPRHIYEGAAADDLARVTKERDGLADSNDGLRDDIRLLRAEVDALKRDPREVERIAREDLNLVRPGEAVFEVERPTSAERGKN